MKVSELAKEYNTTNKDILDKLKTLKLKAKDGNQELNSVVLKVLRSELSKGGKKASPAAPVREEPKAAKRSPAKTAGKPAAKTKPAAKKEPAAKKAEKPAPKKAAPKKAPVKAVEKPKVERPQPAKKISDAPFVPLKPLSKKRRRPMAGKGREPSRDDKTESASASAADAMPGSVGTAGESPEQSSATVVLKPLEVNIPISVKDFSARVEQKTSQILKKLMDLGIFANINHNLGEEMVRKLAREFGYEVTEAKTQEQQLIQTHKVEEEDPKLLKPRAPVITFMGHVDHGKTTLIDKIRKAQVADSEHGGITQHIGAYSVKLPKGKITFLDTPGHEAFTAMRARGAHITDIVVLVVAADEGIMPQTEEAIDHARAANVPIVVALTKIDRKNADQDRVKKQLVEKGLNPEDWGGKTIVVGVSGVTGEGVNQLLEMILLEAELLELKANAKKKASGIVVEAHVSGGKGTVASLIVQSGTLNVQDYIVVGPYYGKVKALFDDMERPIKEAGPSEPVEVMGLSGVPEAGESFYVVEDEKQARDISSARQEQLKNEKLRANKRISLEDLYLQIQEGNVKELNVILKADVQGSVEALVDSLEKIPSTEVKVKFIHTGVGDVNASDVILALASNAIIIAFHVGIGPRAQQELEKHPVDVRQYRIIYDAVNDVRKALEGMLDPRKKRKPLARVDVRQVFKLSRSGIIAGCYVTKGKVPRKAQVEVIRNGDVVHTGKITSLKRFKDDVREVGEGFECGISIEGFDKYQSGDILDVFEIETIARTL